MTMTMAMTAAAAATPWGAGGRGTTTGTTTTRRACAWDRRGAVVSGSGAREPVAVGQSSHGCP
jgi:hypothetical protein